MKEKERHKAVRHQRSEMDKVQMRWRQFYASYDQNNPKERAQAEANAKRLFREIVAAYRTCHQNIEHKAVIEYSRAQYARVLAAAYPPGFHEDYARLRTGDSYGIETAVAFLEQDLMFFGSGYLKENLIQALKRQLLPESMIERLQNVVVALVDTRDAREFRAYCRLAHKVDSPELRQALAQREQSSNPDIRRRACWMREAMEILAHAKRHQNTA